MAQQASQFLPIARQHSLEKKKWDAQHLSYFNLWLSPRLQVDAPPGGSFRAIVVILSNAHYVHRSTAEPRCV
jgi:hypothetical protein